MKTSHLKSLIAQAGVLQLRVLGFNPDRGLQSMILDCNEGFGGWQQK